MNAFAYKFPLIIWERVSNQIGVGVLWRLIWFQNSFCSFLFSLVMKRKYMTVYSFMIDERKCTGQFPTYKILIWTFLAKSIQIEETFQFPMYSWRWQVLYTINKMRADQSRLINDSHIYFLSIFLTNFRISLPLHSGLLFIVFQFSIRALSA